MKNKINIVFIFLLGIILIPQIALAAWWNPFSWKIFNRTSTPVTNITISNNTEVQSSTLIKFDDAVIKSVMMIKIFDNNENRIISSGSGISLGGFGNILTNYHVVEKVFSNPSRYKAYGCVTISLNTAPECNYLLSTTRKLLNDNTVNAKYNKNLDLALLYIDQIKINDEWTSIINISLDNLKDRSINLSSYTKNYNDLLVGSPIYSVGYPDYGGEKTIQVDGAVEKIIKDQQSGQILILSSLNISHGNSGGPVFNSNGELVGVTVQCLTAFLGAYECLTNSGIFIPLPTVNWWYTKVNNSHIISWQGKNYYSSNNGISDNTQKTAFCSVPLKQNSYYDANVSTDNCICKSGFSKNSNGDCVNGSGYVDPSLRYGKLADPEAEKKALQALDSLFSDLNQNSVQTPVLSYLYNNYNPAILKGNAGEEYRNKGLYSAADGQKTDATNYLNLAINSYDDALRILGNNPPMEWKRSYDCLVSGFNNARSASQILLQGVPYFKVSMKSVDYLNQAQVLLNKGILDSVCASNNAPSLK